MTAWLHGGPFDGAALPGLPHVEEITLWWRDRPWRYAHEGPPGELDRLAPDPGTDLHLQTTREEDGRAI